MSPSRRLVLSDIDAEKLEAARSACATPGHLLWPRDLSQPEGVGAEFASFLAKENICIEHFIHSAGIFGLQFARAHDMAFVDRIFNINLFSAIELIRPLTQKKSNSGALRSITIISSVGTRVGAPGQYVYAASKGAVNGLCLALAVELAPTVRVNTVLPSYIESGMNRGQFAKPEFVASIKAMHPVGSGPDRGRGRCGGIFDVRPRPLDFGPRIGRGRRPVGRQNADSGEITECLPCKR